jgi:hypothetical protein
LGEPDRNRKLVLYQELVTTAAAPVGGIWPGSATHIQLQPETANTPANIEAAARLWADLTGT